MGYRNGNRLGGLNTAEGRVVYAVPQVTGMAEPWVSEVKQALSGRTEELERLVVEIYARGLSVRDIEVTFTGADGRCVLTKSAVSPVTERLWEDYLAFAGRGELSGQPILYLFLDGVAERLHLGQPRKPVLAAWGIAASGVKLLLGLYAASKEDAASARECLRDLKARPGADRHRWGAGADPGSRGGLPAEPAATVSGAQTTQPGGQGTRGTLAGGQSSCARGVPGPLAAGGACRRRGVPPPLRAGVSQRGGLLRGRCWACIAHLRLPIARRFGPRICWSGCSVRNGGRLKSFRTPSASGPSSS